MPDPTDVPIAVRDLARRLAEPKPMRRGTLAVRYLRCNKPGCACADREDARHGPYHSVVRVVGGKTRSRHVPAEQAELLHQQIQAGQQFRKEVEAYWQACEQWADAQLDAPEAASATGAAKKRGSKRRSRPRSPPRSPRS
jgi:hypothetical protein